MWTAIIALATKILSIFFPDKSSEKVARDDGVISGQSQQKAADQTNTIEEQKHVIAAQQAMSNVSPIRDDDAINRLRGGTA